MADNPIRLKAPLGDSDTEKLRAGDRVLIDGVIFTGRDAAHKRLVDLIEKGEELPVDLCGAIIYFVGPSPPPPGRPIGSAGPTTSYRMDSYSPILIEKAGLKAMIGKGGRSVEVRGLCQKHKSVYLAATGGAGALLGQCIVSAEVVAYEELGPEAVRRLEVRDFPAIVVNDVVGGDLYEMGRREYGLPLGEILERF
jgi:fumarate hydratase subunit beta